MRLGLRIPGLAVLICSACAEQSAPVQDKTVTRDSAGIIITENPDPVLADSTSWSVDLASVLTIGAVDGADPYLFTSIGGVLQLTDGSILVADRKTEELRRFDSSGRFISKVGGAGEGPSEFVNLYNFRRLRGDSLLVIDYEGGRLHRIDQSGAFNKRWRPRIDGSVLEQYHAAPRVIGVFDDGHLLLQDYRLNCARPRTLDPMYCEDSSRFVRAADDGSVLTDFGTFVTHRRHEQRLRNRDIYIQEGIFPQAYAAVSGGQFYFADAGAFEVRVYRSDGTLFRIIRAAFTRPPGIRELPEPARPPPGASNDRVVAYSERMDARSRVQLPEFAPAFMDMLVDRVGNIWLQQYNRDRWWVIDSTGVVRNQIRVPRTSESPRGALVLNFYGTGGEIGNDYILGIVFGGEGVHYAQRLRLVK